MNRDITRKLWVLKFCLKLLYPNLNCVGFLVYLAIKYKKTCRKYLREGPNMDTFCLKSISATVQWMVLNKNNYENKDVLLEKCLIISRNQFAELLTNNLFYVDNGILWVALKLSKKSVSHQREVRVRDKSTIFNLNFVNSNGKNDLFSATDKHRVVPIFGSTCVPNNVIYATENESHNILKSFNFSYLTDIELTFHPIPRLANCPTIASSAEVSVIVNDYDLSNDFVKETLSNYFQIPKLLHPDDIFYINLTPSITTKYHYKYADLVQSVGKLHFKCQKINNGNEKEEQNSSDNIEQPFFIVKGVTQLTLGESIHELKPKEQYFETESLRNKQLMLLDACPTGLRHTFEQMQESIAPFLKGNLDSITSCLSSPLMPTLLLTAPAGSGGHVLIRALAKYNGLTRVHVDCVSLQSSTAKQTEGKLGASVQRAKTAAPALLVLDNFEVFAVDAENNEDSRITEYFVNTLHSLYENYTKHAIVIIALTERADLKPNIQRIFLETFSIPKMGVQERYDTLQWFCAAMELKIGDEPLDDDDEAIRIPFAASRRESPLLRKMAAKTDTFSMGDLDALLHFALREARARRDGAGRAAVDESHFDAALESMRALQSHQLDAPKIPTVRWEDIGGLTALKEELLKTIEFPIKYPHLFKNAALKRSGILLYGPPGCGKTLVAKAVSTELNVSFLSVKGPELLNMYIGQSEENVRRVFASARAAAPCIVFLDELDALAARRGAAGDSGGAADRLVSQLLAELDGVVTQQDTNATNFVFVMGATNRPDLLEPSLLRPGRLDRRVYVGPYSGDDEKIGVLTALCRRHKLAPEVCLAAVARALPPRATGADLRQVVASARAAAVRRLLADVDAGLVKESDLGPDSVVIGAAELLHGVECFRPSVTDEELAHYESLERQL